MSHPTNHKMTRLHFLTLALEGARARKGLAQKSLCGELEWEQLHHDVNYIDARLRDEKERLRIKAVQKALEKPVVLDKRKLTPRALTYLEQFK